MIARITDVCVAAVLVLAITNPATAQTSRIEVTGGYQTVRVLDQTLPLGWSADCAANLDAAWSIVGEASAAHKTERDENLGFDVDLSLHAFGAGARWSSRAGRRIIPFLQVLAGAVRARAKAVVLGVQIGDSSTRFTLQPGGGVNVRVTDALGLVGQIDYRRIFLDEEEDGESGRNEFRIFVGLRLAP